MRSIVFILFLFPTLAFCGEPVFLIHGFMRSKGSMKKMENTFQCKGYETINYDYPSRKKTIEEHGRDLAIVLKEYAKNHPEQSIHFATHSLGGIILRAALNHPECPDEAKRGRAVLLGPPNHGSAFGRFIAHIDPVRKALGNESGTQLTTREDFDDLGEFPEEMEILIISGTAGWNPTIEGENDAIVGFYESCLNTYHHHMCIPTLHSFMMYNETVIFNTIRFIENVQENSPIEVVEQINEGKTISAS